MIENGITAGTLCYFNEFGKPAFQLLFIYLKCNSYTEYTK